MITKYKYNIQLIFWVMLIFFLNSGLSGQITLSQFKNDLTYTIQSSDLTYISPGQYEFSVKGGPGFCRIIPSSLPFSLIIVHSVHLLIHLYPEGPIIDASSVTEFPFNITFDAFPYGVNSLMLEFNELGICTLQVSSDDVFPVELASFSAVPSKNDVILKWQTNAEMNNYGFEVERKPLTVETGHPLSLQNPTSPIWSKIGFVSGAGNSNSVKEYSFTDKEIKGGKYQYRLKQIDNDGKFSYSEVVEVDVALPAEFKLEQNYPNPFNPTTTIEYQLPVNSHVTLELYSITGELAATLVDAEMEAGYYNYQVSTSNHCLSSGVYFYRLTVNDINTKNTNSVVKKMMFMK